LSERDQSPRSNLYPVIPTGAPRSTDPLSKSQARSGEIPGMLTAPYRFREFSRELPFTPPADSIGASRAQSSCGSECTTRREPFCHTISRRCSSWHRTQELSAAPASA